MKTTMIALAVIWLGFFALVGFLATFNIDAAMGTMILGLAVLSLITAMIALESKP